MPHLPFRLIVPGAIAVAVTLVVVLAVPGAAAETQSRSVTGFDRVTVDGVFDTEITAGSAHTSVTVTAEPDVLARVTTEVRGNTLYVGMRSDNNTNLRSLKLAIALPVLHRFSNNGAGSARLNGLTGADLEIENSGVGGIRAAGRAGRLNITLEGVGKVDTTDVDARDVTVENDGVGSVYVRASGKLNLSVNGVGEIGYKGNPTDVERHVSGVGRIRRL